MVETWPISCKQRHTCRRVLVTILASWASLWTPKVFHDTLNHKNVLTDCTGILRKIKWAALNWNFLFRFTARYKPHFPFFLLRGAFENVQKKWTMKKTAELQLRTSHTMETRSFTLYTVAVGSVLVTASSYVPLAGPLQLRQCLDVGRNKSAMATYDSRFGCVSVLLGTVCCVFLRYSVHLRTAACLVLTWHIGWCVWVQLWKVHYSTFTMVLLSGNTSNRTILRTQQQQPSP